MSISGFAVDPEALSAAARSIRSAVTDGTTETQCVAWGLGYGHEGLAGAVVTFAGDVDLAVDRLADEGEAMASALVDQAEGYRSVDSGVQDTFTGAAVPAGGR